MHATLLIELRTEELPPRSLKTLSQAFGDGIVAGLRAKDFLGDAASATLYATPRRLAVSICDVRADAPDRIVDVKGPHVSVGLAADGTPAPALLGFMKKNGVADLAGLGRASDRKGEHFVYRHGVRGGRLDDALSAIVEEALRRLPIPKLMRWGDSDAQFVRPVHGLVMLHGDRQVLGEVLGLPSGRTTLGHRFLGAGRITFAAADAYAAKLRDEGSVIAGFDARRDAIRSQLDALASREHATLAGSDDLLDEVTALVEWPAIYVGTFEQAFLAVPQECLILTMRQNQKYFPLLDRDGRLLPRFLIVSNMALDDPVDIVRGNERVVRPRLADARFFYDQDRKSPLSARLAELERMVYHNKLGTQRERVARLERMAAGIAQRLGADPVAATRAALLCKCDLATGMVGEFPELQGVMGRYYALHDGEPADVAQAIEQHYRPRFAADDLPEPGIATVLALADRIDTLTGIFGIGLVPTGDKDPFALRRQALGVLRILSERSLPLDLHDLLALAAGGYPPGRLAGGSDALFAFIQDRLRGYLRERDGEPNEIEAVLAGNDGRIDRVGPRLAAVREFRALPESAALAAANKRIQNILRKAEPGPDSSARPGDAVREDLLTADAERALHARLAAVEPDAGAAIARGDYTGALRTLAGLRAEVDRFFEDVMVNADDAAVRANRLALLGRLAALMNRVADISRLAT
jgi:glycyl-tRNA synthetase beta chain